MGELYFNCTLTKPGNVWIGVLTITLDFIILMMPVPLYFSLLIIVMKSLKESWTILFWKKSLVLEKVFFSRYKVFTFKGLRMSA